LLIFGLSEPQAGLWGPSPERPSRNRSEMLVPRMADSQGFWSLRPLRTCPLKLAPRLSERMFRHQPQLPGIPPRWVNGSMKPCIGSPASSNRDFEQSTDAVRQFPHDSGSKGRIIRNSYVTVHQDAIPSFKPWNQEPTQPRCTDPLYLRCRFFNFCPQNSKMRRRVVGTHLSKVVNFAQSPTRDFS
jgi:hypothetical protein